MSRLSLCAVSYHFLFLLPQDEREARENVKREQDEAYRISLEADRAKVCVWQSGSMNVGT